jgi:hypothetical protein
MYFPEQIHRRILSMRECIIRLNASVGLKIKTPQSLIGRQASSFPDEFSFCFQL